MLVRSYLPSLMAALSEVADPRQRRGVRHPFSAILGLTLVGLVCRLNDFAGLQRWAARNWHLLRRPLGFTRHKPPHPTDVKSDPGEVLVGGVSSGVFAVVARGDGGSGGTGRGGGWQDVEARLRSPGRSDSDAECFCPGFESVSWAMAPVGEKSTEPEVLKAHLNELFEKYPALRLITGDALYAQRNLAELILTSGHDYLFQIKANQPDILDAANTCFAQAQDNAAAAHTREKKGAARKLVFFGSTWPTPHMSASGWVLPVAACSCESTERGKTEQAKPHAKRGISSPASIRPRLRPSNY